MCRLVCFLLAAALTLGVALAQEPPSFYKPATSVSTSAINSRATGASPAGGIAALLTMKGVDDSGRAAAYKTRGINYAPSTLGKLGRTLGRVGGPLAVVAAMSAIVDAAGWFIDEVSGQVLVSAPVSTSIPPGGYYWQDSVQAKTHPTATAAAQFMLSAGYSPSFDTVEAAPVGCGVENVNTGYVDCRARLCKSWAPSQCIEPGLTRYRNNGSTAYTTTGPAPASPPAVADEAIGNALANHPNAWPDLLSQPNGMPRPTPEVAQALADYKNELEQAAGVTPTTPPAPDPNFETSENTASTEWPGFCSWATKVCDFIDWYRTEPPEPDDIDMPEVQLPGVSPWTSSLGAGSCPAPFQLDLNTGGQSYEWDPWCDLALRIKPLVIASAAFAALLILAGVSRRSNGDA